MPYRTLAQLNPAGRYRVFRRKRTPDLCCAVREGWSVPRFVIGEAWERCGTATGARAPGGFEPDAARAAMPLIGFYLFLALRA